MGNHNHWDIIDGKFNVPGQHDLSLDFPGKPSWNDGSRVERPYGHLFQVPRWDQPWSRMETTRNNWTNYCTQFFKSYSIIIRNNHQLSYVYMYIWFSWSDRAWTGVVVGRGTFGNQRCRVWIIGIVLDFNISSETSGSHFFHDLKTYRDLGESCCRLSHKSMYFPLPKVTYEPRMQVSCYSKCIANVKETSRFGHHVVLDPLTQLQRTDNDDVYWNSWLLVACFFDLLFLFKEKWASDSNQFQGVEGEHNFCTKPPGYDGTY